MSVAAAPVAATAAGWTPVTGSLGSSIHQIAQTRSSDGTLRLAWTEDIAGGSENVLYSSITSAGVVQSATTIANGYAAAGNPAIVAGPGSNLTIYFGGIQCTTTGCPQGLFSSTSTDGGATWSSPVSLLNTDEVYASDINATTLADGTPFQTWWHTTGTTVHRGNAVGTDYDFQGAMGAGCCGYESNLAADSAGNLELAWYSNATNFMGVWVRSVDPGTGAPSGSPQLMPASTVAGQPSSGAMTSRTPLVALPSGGFDVAYPGGSSDLSQVLLWHVGASTSTTVVNEPGAHDDVSLAVDGASRVWVFWSHSGHVFADRVDPDGTIEAPIDLGEPVGGGTIYALDGSVDPAGDPEVLALTALPNSTYETYYIRGPQIAPVTPPVLGQSFDASVLSGTVLIKLPGTARDSVVKGSGFEPLTIPRVLPTGTQVDARAGTIALVSATAKQGKTQSANFGGGLFKIAQSASGLSKGLTTVSVLEDAFPGAPGYSQCGHASADPAALNPHVGPLAGAAGGPPKKVLQTLNAHDNGGQFGTRTKASAATVRGTTWTTLDTCGGTITKVKRGVVSVFAFRTRKTVRVRAGHSYYARLP